jgi:hypothetical protein
MLFGGVVAIAAIAAGAFFVLRPHPTTEPIVVSQPAAPLAAPVTQTGAAQPAAPAAQNAAPAVPAAGDTVDPMALPAAKQAAPPAAIAKGDAPKTAPVAATKSGTKAEAPKADETKPELVAKDLPSSPATTGALGDAMKQAAGPSTDSPAPAAPGGDSIQPGSMAQKPSQGAVTGALGAVLPAARACLGPDDPVSRAQVVFGSNGSVESVNVSGAAAGKPAEACIKTALGKAKVQPFAQATYSATVTVRPN